MGTQKKHTRGRRRPGKSGFDLDGTEEGDPNLPRPARGFAAGLKPDEEEVLAAIQSLYRDQLKPFGRILRKRIAENSVAHEAEQLDPEDPSKRGRTSLPDVDIKHLKDLCDMSPRLTIAPEDGGDWSAVFNDCPENFVDIYSSDDPFPPSFWMEADRYFSSLYGSDSELPGGRYSCAQALIARNLAFLSNMTLGQVCHMVQLGISKHKILGYCNGAVVPYAMSQSMLKEHCAANQKPISSSDGIPNVGAMLALADLATARICLREILEMVALDPYDDQSFTSVPLSNVKRLFRSRYKLELSETALGHSKLSELLQDERFSDICTVELHGNGYIVIQTKKWPRQENRMPREPDRDQYVDDRMPFQESDEEGASSATRQEIPVTVKKSTNKKRPPPPLLGNSNYGIGSQVDLSPMTPAGAGYPMPSPHYPMPSPFRPHPSPHPLLSRAGSLSLEIPSTPGHHPLYSRTGSQQLDTGFVSTDSSSPGVMHPMMTPEESPGEPSPITYQRWMEGSRAADPVFAGANMFSYQHDSSSVNSAAYFAPMPPPRVQGHSYGLPPPPGYPSYLPHGHLPPGHPPPGYPPAGGHPPPGYPPPGGHPPHPLGHRPHPLGHPPHQPNPLGHQHPGYFPPAPHFPLVPPPLHSRPSHPSQGLSVPPPNSQANTRFGEVLGSNPRPPPPPSHVPPPPYVPPPPRDQPAWFGSGYVAAEGTASTQRTDPRSSVPKHFSRHISATPSPGMEYRASSPETKLEARDVKRRSRDDSALICRIRGMANSMDQVMQEAEQLAQRQQQTSLRFRFPSDSVIRAKGSAQNAEDGSNFEHGPRRPDLSPSLIREEEVAGTLVRNTFIDSQLTPVTPTGAGLRRSSSLPKDMFSLRSNEEDVSPTLHFLPRPGGPDDSVFSFSGLSSEHLSSPSSPPFLPPPTPTTPYTGFPLPVDPPSRVLQLSQYFW